MICMLLDQLLHTSSLLLNFYRNVSVTLYSSSPTGAHQISIYKQEPRTIASIMCDSHAISLFISRSFTSFSAGLSRRAHAVRGGVRYCGRSSSGTAIRKNQTAKIGPLKNLPLYKNVVGSELAVYVMWNQLPIWASIRYQTICETMTQTLYIQISTKTA